MTRVLLVGLQPEAVDYSDPALPLGMDAKKIQAGIEQGPPKAVDDHALHHLACLVCFSGRSRDAFIISSWPSSSSATKPRPPHVGH